MMTKTSILIIEDDDNDYHEIESRLQESGEILDLERVTRLPDALTLLERQMTFDLLFVDLTLPGLSGHSISYAYDVLRERLPQGKIIVLTGHHDTRLADRINASGGEYLLKDEALTGESRLLVFRLLKFLISQRNQQAQQTLENLRVQFSKLVETQNRDRNDWRLTHDSVNFLNQRILRAEIQVANFIEQTKDLRRRANSAENHAAQALGQALKLKAQPQQPWRSFVSGVCFALLLWLGAMAGAYFLLKS